MNNMDKPKIFISYSRKDSEIAERVYKDLQNEGFAPWLDKESLLPGQNWKMMISKEMKESSFFLALLSSDSLGKRGYVNKELRFALDILDEFPLDEIYLIPVYIDHCEPLDERLRDIHGIHLYESYERGVKKLIHALNHYTKSRAGNKTDSSSIDEKKRIQIDNLEYEKNKKAAPARTVETSKPSIKQTLDIDTLLAQALKKYDLLLKNHGSQYKDQAWQAICSEFSMFTQGVNHGDIWEVKFKAGLFKAGDTWAEPVTGMEFVWVPAGCYMMGSNSSEASSHEKPVHEVCLDSFWIGKYQLSQGQYKKIVGNNPSKFKSGEDYPVERVSWEKAKDFISKFNQQSGKRFSLPTEAQWEYAARSGGEDQEYAGGNDVEQFAWYESNSGDTTHAVGTKASNELGIYDMSGNVWEWCEDVYDENAYEKHEHNNPLITSGSTYRVIRGGSWIFNPRYVRAAFRVRFTADYRFINLGFRLCLSQVRQ
jgi:formylglycine-generating enzyme required for sulfatase activity